MNKRIDNFDYLRIICSSLLVFSHYQMFYAFRFENGLNFHRGVINFGLLVELFFMISGFLAVNGKSDKRYFGALLRKWVRLYPMALLSVGLSLLNILVRLMFSIEPVPHYPAGSIVASIFMVHEGWLVNCEHAVNSPTWYICVLFVIYVIYYAIEAMDRTFRIGKVKSFIYFVIFALAIALRDTGLPFFSNKSCRGYLAFFFGVMLHKLYISIDRKKHWVLCLSLLSCGVVFFDLSAFYSLWGSIPAIFFFGSLIILLVSIKQYPTSIGRLLGAASFEVYLFHVPLIELSCLCANVLSLTYEHSLITMIVFLLFTEIIAIFIYRCVERPLSGKINTLLKEKDQILCSQ